MKTIVTSSSLYRNAVSTRRIHWGVRKYYSVQSLKNNETSVEQSSAIYTSARTTPHPKESSIEISTLNNNLTVATTGSILPAVGIVWRIPAGSRYEDANTIGYSHYLRQAFFEGNSKESGLALARRTELRGANLSIANDRDSITFTSDCPHSEASGIIESLSSMLHNFKLEHYNISAIKSRVDLDCEIRSADSSLRLWDSAFEAAFRSGIANTPLCTKDSTPTAEDLQQFLASRISRSGHVIAAAGLSHAEFTDTLKHKFTSKVGILKSVNAGVKYFGGERRIEANTEQDHVLVAFGAGGLYNPLESRVAKIIAAALNGKGSIQYGLPYPQLDRLRKVLEKNPSISVQAEVQECADGGLLGVTVSGPSVTPLKPIVEAICQEFKNIASTGITNELLTGAKAQAAFNIALTSESRIGTVSSIASQLLVRSEAMDAAQEINAIHSITPSDVKTTAAKILSRKPVFVSLGNLRSLPYADELNY